MAREARNIVNFYGGASLSRLIEDLRNGVSLTTIAERMNVSRQRVHQWKQALGYEEKTWKPYPGVTEVIDDEEQSKR
jgi:transposase